MAKAVHWKIPFVSLNGTRYHIDIYDEGYTGDPVQLLAGPQPFVTDEDTSDNYFNAVRSQTGNLQVCTAIPSGGILKLEDILPANQLSRPVRLIDISNSNAVVWQGFLSSEAYSQDYTSVPQILSLPVISVLEAMDSVELYEGFSNSFVSILTHIAYVLGSVNREVGINRWLGNIYFPARYYEAMRDCKLYNNWCWNSEEITDQENITVDIHSKPCKNMLSIIATFFGCVVRESGRNIFITDVQNYAGTRTYQYLSVANLTLALIDHLTPLSVTAYSESGSTNISSLIWKGSGHKKSCTQGKRRVQLSANLKQFECNINLPPTPYGNLHQGVLNTSVYANSNDQSYSLVTYKYLRLSFTVPSNTTDPYTLTFWYFMTTNSYTHTAFWDLDTWRQNYKQLVAQHTQSGNFRPYATAYLALYTDDEGVENTGLMVCGFPTRLRYGDNQYRPFTRFALTPDYALYTIRTAMTFAAHNGWLNIDAAVKMFNCADSSAGTGISTGSKAEFTLALQFGSKWWDGSAWTNTFSTFPVSIDDKGVLETNKTEDMDTKEDAGYFIPITAPMNGVVTLKLFHEMTGEYINILDYDTYYPLTEALFTKLEVKYVTPDSVTLSDRSTNNYAQATGAEFHNEEKVNLEIATDLYNDIRANMLFSSEMKTVKLLSLEGTNIRPEVDLLNRMTAYYSAARQQLKLEVEHPTDAPLPAMLLNGINDGKKYVPLAESRDWADDKSTITCFETVNE